MKIKNEKRNENMGNVGREGCRPAKWVELRKSLGSLIYGMCNMRI